MDTNQEMLQQIHERIIRYRLREGFSGKKDFSVKNVVSPASISKWEGKPHKKLFTAAQKGEKAACEYIFYKMEPAIQAAFWKNYLGPSGAIRRDRIVNESAWEEWLGIAWMTLTGGFNEANAEREGYFKGDDEKQVVVVGALDKKTKTLKGSGEEKQTGFDPAKVSEDKLLNVFAGRYKLLLMNAALNANTAKRIGGITGSGGEVENLKTTQYETWTEHDEGFNPDNDDMSKSGERGYDDSTFREVEDSIQSKEFLAKWVDYCQDPGLKKSTKSKTGKKVSVADILAAALEGNDVGANDIANNIKVARNTVTNYLTTAVNLLGDYKISQGDLNNAIKVIGNDRIASYLTSIEEAPKKAPVIDDKPLPSHFLKKFEIVFNDDAIWSPAGEVDPANALLYWIKSNFAPEAKIAKKAGTTEKVIRARLKKALKVLDDNGISEDKLKQMVKQFGKDVVAARIGDQS